MRLKSTLYLFLFIIFSCYSQGIFSQSIKGRVTTSSGNPLQKATVSLKGQGFKTITNVNGEYEINNIKAGNYILEISFVSYLTEKKQVEVKEGQVSTVNILLSEKSTELQNVSIFGKMNKEQETSSRSSEKNANNITNIISAAAMQRSPDVNAANVLQRMSGITLQKNSGSDEAYSIIRGMEPRYNNTLINGVKITSPDEKSRFVSLNIVPSDLLQRIEVSKSLLPDMEGDAIGGTVNLIMKDAPDTTVFKAIASIGYSNIFFDRKYDNFSKKDIQNKSIAENFGSGHSAQPSDFTRSNLDFKKISAPPTGIVGVTFGKRFFNNKIGFLIADNFIG